MPKTMEPEEDQYTADLGIDPAGEAEPPKKRQPKARTKSGSSKGSKQGSDESAAGPTDASSAAAANAAGETPAEYGASMPSQSTFSASGQTPMEISVANAAKLNQGLHSVERNGHQEWVPTSQLTKTEQQEEATQSNAAPLSLGNTNAPTATPPSAAEALMGSLVGQYQQAMGVVDPYINGSVGGTDSALAAKMGASIGGATQPAPAAAGVANSALTADAQNYQKANDAGAAGIQTALKNTGLADQQYLSASPYVGLLNALTSEATYKQETAAAGGAGLSEPAGSPTWYTNALKTLAGSNPSSVSGATQVGGQPATTSTTPSTDNQSTAGGGNAA